MIGARTIPMLLAAALLSACATKTVIIKETTTVTNTVTAPAPAPLANRGPVFSGPVTCDPCSARTGAAVTLAAFASDPDGDPIAFVWSAVAGTFSAPGSARTMWTAPATAGTFTITVIATDRTGAAAIQSIALSVADAPPAGPVDPNRVTVFYGTNRQRLAAGYGNELAPATSYGTCDVSIPRDHRRGAALTSGFAAVIGARLARAVFRTDLTGTVSTPPKILTRAAFTTALRQGLAASPRKEALVFVHGFNVGFDEACQRTAQIAADIDFNGAPIMFAWPAHGSEYRYAADQAHANQSGQALADFLRLVVEQTGAQYVTVLAHSMGNRVLVRALAALQRAHARPLGQVIFAAPDVEQSAFDAAVALLPDVTQRATLYVSENDRALEFAPGTRRVGLLPPVYIAKGLDTINVSPIDQDALLGHSYYGSNREVLTDLKQLVLDKTAPPRLLLQPLFDGDRQYWRFQP